MTARATDAHRWKKLGQELLLDLCAPGRHPSFVIYFVSLVVLLAGLGVGIAILGDYQASPRTTNAATTIATYVMSLFATALVDVILGTKKGSDMRSVYTLLSLVAAALTFAVWHASSFAVQLWCGIPAVINGWLCWWLVNANNSHLLGQDADPACAAGGDTNAPLSGTLQNISH